MPQVITGLSSMATRVLLAELAADIERRHDIEVQFTSGGGVHVAQLIRDGAAADVAVLAADAMASLEGDRLLLPESLRPLFVSEVVAAVPGDAAGALRTEADLRALVATAHRIAYSTGPSGSALLDLLQRWGIADASQDRLLQAPPGVPVGSLLATGEADVGFQQHSELMDLAGVRVLGPLPGDAAIRSVFCGGVLAASHQRDLAEHVLDLLVSPASAGLVVACGMTPAGD